MIAGVEVEHKTKGDVIKIRVTQDDLSRLATGMIIPILTEFARDHPERIIPVQSYSLELRGDLIVTITSSGDPAAILEAT
jgi:hypothetical protein